MDPLSALSLAGNIIQFIDFGGKLLSSARELYKSSVGVLNVNEEITLITTDLEGLLEKLRGSLCASQGNHRNQDGINSLNKICDEAAAVAQELLTRLGTLRITPGCKHRKWESLRVAIRSLWNEKEIASLSKRLAMLKEVLKTRVLLSLSESLDMHSIQTSASFSKLDQQTQQILFAITGLHTDLKGQISQTVREEMAGLTATVGQILCRLDSVCQDAKHKHLLARCSVLENICKREQPDLGELRELNAGIEMLSVSGSSERNLRVTLQEAILENLEYDEMTTRYENVIEAHPQTFQWAFDAPAEERSWSDLSRWLKRENGVYWVTGKAGSGKSTFMKHLVEGNNRKSLTEALGSWAEASELCLATFFFWNSGTKLQQSQLGLLRALLFQVLTQYPSLIPIVFPKEWSTLYSKAVVEATEKTRGRPDLSGVLWKFNQLKDALRALSNQTMIPIKICFIIDGLDEFDGDDGDYEELGNLIKEITASQQVKVCLSSRPWIVFEDLFGACPNLKLQNLTHRDIEQYVHDKFYSSSAFLKLASREPVAAPGLLSDIIGKADGVFLWVELVVRSLLKGIRNRDDIADLSEHLDRLPKDLKPLYRRLLDLIEPYERWASQAIQIVRCNRYVCSISSEGLGAHLTVRPLTISELSLAMNEKIPMSSLEKMTAEQFQLQYEETSVKLTARCAGFLEVSNAPGKSVMGPISLVQYFHRTAKDFLESEEVWGQILLWTKNTDFSPSVALMRSCLWFIKVQISFTAAFFHKSIHREVEASAHAVGFMTYALDAELESPSRVTQTALFDQMSDLIIEHDKNRKWLYKGIPYFQGESSFLELTVLFGLTGYVRDTLKKLPKTQLETTATSLLRFGLHRVDTIGRIPCPTLRLISLLLDLGADIRENHTALIRTIQHAKKSIDNLQSRDKFRGTTAIYPEYWFNFDFDSARCLCDRIEETVRNRNADAEVRIIGAKRIAEATDDEEMIFPPYKRRMFEIKQSEEET